MACGAHADRQLDSNLTVDCLSNASTWRGMLSVPSVYTAIPAPRATGQCEGDELRVLHVAQEIRNVPVQLLNHESPHFI